MIFSRINYYWKRSKTTIFWKIAYRVLKDNSILKDTKTPFKIFKTEKGTWGADPFLCDYNGETYLFFELFIDKKNKGVIACSKWNGKEFDKPQTVLEEDFHLSFPCIFSINETFYMIPETGSQKKVILYECENFPDKWVKKKVLVEGFTPSDVIVREQGGEVFVLVSALKNSACVAENLLYLLDKETLELKFCKTVSEISESGIRNAGYVFEEDGVLYRPGQNCPQNEYGKSLYFWKINALSEADYSEEFLKEINIDDIKIDLGYCGIHTYNQNDNLEVIDLKTIEKTPLLKRLSIMCRTVKSYFNKG